jgi:hypothetical protein
MAVPDACSLDGQPVSNKELAGLLGIRESDLAPSVGRRPLGLGLRQENGQLRLLFRKPNHAGLRFEAARILADWIPIPDSESWLPATDSKTARQKTQRAFAAEFLCPVEALQAFLDRDYSQEAMDYAAEHFGVSDYAIRSHLATHRLIPHDWIADK